MNQPILPRDPRRLSNKRVAKYAEQLSKAYAYSCGDVPALAFTLNFDVAYDDYLYPEFGILLEEGEELGYDQGGEKILGVYDAESNAIALDQVLEEEESARRTFTAWHEVAHALLHRTWIRSNGGMYQDSKTKTSTSSLDREVVDRLERQANLFAGHVAAPKWFLDFAIKTTFQLDRPLAYRGPFSYSLYPHGIRKQCQIESFEQFCMLIAYQIRDRFGMLSIEALMYRIPASDWVVDTTSRNNSGVFHLHRTAGSAVPAGV